VAADRLRGIRRQPKTIERTGRIKELLRQVESESTGKRHEKVEKFEACGKSARKPLQIDLL
jgi:hypothetical protein